MKILPDKDKYACSGMLSFAVKKLTGELPKYESDCYLHDLAYRGFTGETRAEADERT